MRFWDSSAVVPLLVDEPSSEPLRVLLRQDPVMLVWWGTRVECWSALSRRRRDGLLTIEQEEQARRALQLLIDSWAEILPSEELRHRAGRLLRVHPLRAADSLQLAAALVWADSPVDGDLVSLDERLAAAGRLEGLAILP